jgi:hypothetical protein
LDLLLADIDTGQSRVVLTETSKSWIDLNNELSFLTHSREFIWASSRDGYQQPPQVAVITVALGQAERGLLATKFKLIGTPFIAEELVSRKSPNWLTLRMPVKPASRRYSVRNSSFNPTRW